MQLHRIALSSVFALSLALPLAGCLDDDPEAPLAEAVEELSLSDSVYSGFYAPVTPAVFRGTDWRVQVVGANASGYVAMDIQADPGIWGAPNVTVVSTALTARYVAAAQDTYGRTVIYAVTNGGWLVRTQQTQPGSRLYNNWIYVDTAVAVRAPSLVAEKDGRLVVAYVASNNHVKTMTQASANAWNGAVDTGYTTTGTPVLTRDRWRELNEDRPRLELFIPRATAPCGFTYTRERLTNGTQGWTPAMNVAGACFTTLAVGYADDATDVLGRTSGGTINHHTRGSSDALFQAGPLSFGVGGQPSFVAKDDGRLFAFTSINSCPYGYPPGSYGCADYYASQRQGGAWWAWQPYATAGVGVTVSAVDSIINNTYTFALINSTTQYQRSLFRY